MCKRESEMRVSVTVRRGKYSTFLHTHTLTSFHTCAFYASFSLLLILCASRPFHVSLKSLHNTCSFIHSQHFSPIYRSLIYFSLSFLSLSGLYLCLSFALSLLSPHTFLLSIIFHSWSPAGSLCLPRFTLSLQPPVFSSTPAFFSILPYIFILSPETPTVPTTPLARPHPHPHFQSYIFVPNLRRSFHLRRHLTLSSRISRTASTKAACGVGAEDRRLQVASYVGLVLHLVAVFKL